MCFLPHCSLVATGHEDGAVRLWNFEVNTWMELKCDERQRHRNSVSAVAKAFSNGVEFLICSDYDAKITVWEISEKKTAHSSVETQIYSQIRGVIQNNATPLDKKSGKKETGVHYYLNPKFGSEVLSVIHNGVNDTIIAGGNSCDIHVWKMHSWEYQTSLIVAMV